MSVKLYIRDNTNGNIHEYGTNQHDALILQDDGSLHYKNLQNGCGTMYPDEGYTFCEADGSDPRTREDYIQYGVEPYIDIGGKGEEHQAKDTNVPNNRWISVKQSLPETDGIYIVCDRRLNGNPWIHTAGFKKASSSWCELHGIYYDDGYGRYSEQGKITHWQPMPEPPET